MKVSIVMNVGVDGLVMLEFVNGTGVQKIIRTLK
jgi:hypothetical protein